ncbi:MAG: hypothetical protein ACYDD4_03555 [Acidimicrobiales bacterium]
MPISQTDIDNVVSAARVVPRSSSDYLIDDFVSNLILTVLDFQMHTTTVERAYKHYQDHHYNQLRTIEDLKVFVARYADDKHGNTALAQALWGYNLWTRAAMLRHLADFFDRIGVRDQNALRSWAERAEFKRDFEGQVRGLGPAVFQWLVMRQGVETVKPDVHVRRFAERAVGRSLNDNDVVDVVTRVAGVLGMKAYELDWSIWEYERSQ